MTDGSENRPTNGGVMWQTTTGACAKERVAKSRKRNEDNSVTQNATHTRQQLPEEIGPLELDEERRRTSLATVAKGSVYGVECGESQVALGPSRLFYPFPPQPKDFTAQNRPRRQRFNTSGVYTSQHTPGSSVKRSASKLQNTKRTAESHSRGHTWAGA